MCASLLYCSICICVWPINHCGRRPVPGPASPHSEIAVRRTNLSPAKRPHTILPPSDSTDYPKFLVVRTFYGPTSLPPLERRTPVRAKPSTDGLLKVGVISPPRSLSRVCAAPPPDRRVIHGESLAILRLGIVDNGPQLCEGPSTETSISETLLLVRKRPRRA